MIWLAKQSIPISIFEDSKGLNFRYCFGYIECLELISVAIGAAYEHFYGAAIGMTFYPWQPSFK